MDDNPDIPTKPTVKVRIMENDVFHVAVDETWMPMDKPGMRPGDAAFRHYETDFNLLQTVFFYGNEKTVPADMTVPPAVPKADRKHVLTEVFASRLKSLGSNGHTLQPGKVGFDEEEWGWVAVCDCILDGKLYGIMAGYAFPECMLVHWIDGPTGKEDAIKQAIMKVMATVSYRTPRSVA